MDWKHLLAYITGTVDQELLLRNEYLVTENRILRDQLKGRVRLSDGERKTLAEIGQKLGKQALAEVAKIVKPDTILGWHRKFVAQKFDGSQQRKSPGRPTIGKEVEALVVRMAQENRSWGYDRIVGALANLGYTLSDQTVGNILKRHGLPPAPERKTTTTWKEFIRTHMDVVWSKNSCGLTLVVFQEASEPFMALNWALALAACAGCRKEEDVAFPLVISLVMIMGSILRQSVLQGLFPKENQPRETLLFDRSNPALGVGIQIR
jgi:transposase